VDLFGMFCLCMLLTVFCHLFGSTRHKYIFFN
jgi:hypothetical protein